MLYLQMDVYMKYSKLTNFKILKRQLNTVNKKSVLLPQYYSNNNSNTNVFKKLPKVPMTKYLESRELTKDILYSGYRPVMYPVRENPLFRNKKNFFLFNEKTNGQNDDSKRKNDSKNENQIINNELLYGHENNGGIKTCGMNSQWKYSPLIPKNLYPYSWWSSSIMGMEIYPEWCNIPKSLIKRLKPFQHAKTRIK